MFRINVIDFLHFETKKEYIFQCNHEIKDMYNQFHSETI
jgi:hypothetical protein